MKITDKKRWQFIEKYKCTLSYLELYEMWVCSSKVYYGVGYTPEDCIDRAIMWEIKYWKDGEINDAFIE